MIFITAAVYSLQHPVSWLQRTETYLRHFWWTKATKSAWSLHMLWLLCMIDINLSRPLSQNFARSFWNGRRRPLKKMFGQSKRLQKITVRQRSFHKLFWNIRLGHVQLNFKFFDVSKTVLMFARKPELYYSFPVTEQKTENTDAEIKTSNFFQGAILVTCGRHNRIVIIRPFLIIIQLQKSCWCDGTRGKISK